MTANIVRNIPTRQDDDEDANVPEEIDDENEVIEK
jgi:hypothetical protein